MSLVEYVCVFIRAAGDRLLTAERLVCGFPHLFGPALVECDLGFRLASQYLVLVLRFDPQGMDDSVRARLAFWTARAGGRASALDGMAPRDRQGFVAQFDLCELKAKGVRGAALLDGCARLFTEAGAPPGRRRTAADRPMLAMDVGGPGWEGVTYDPQTQRLFLAAPMAPPTGDQVPLVFRIPGVSRPVLAKSVVAAVRTPGEATAGKPAGFTLLLQGAEVALHDALVKHCRPDDGGFRTAPRFHVKAPVKVLVPAPPPTQAEPTRAIIEYASDQQLQADFIENLSQGGAFIRSTNPQPVGTPIALDFRLPNGAQLRAQAIVAFANDGGMGVKFTLDADTEEALQAAIAHISARARRALVVDDDALVRRMMADALTERGFEVLTAAEGGEGLRVVSEELLGLDLLITDVFMAGMDGQTFVKTIREAGGETDLAIVVVTGKMEPGLERKLELAGADAVLDKALGPELVAQAADAVIERKRLGRDT
jgi:CheY-like chemotaxis protein